MSRKKWITTYEDAPGSKHVRRVSDTRFHWIELTDMDDACGRDNEGQPRYCCELSEIDLETLPDKAIEGAIQCCGGDWMEEAIENGGDRNLILSEMCHDYGAKAPMWSGSGNNMRNLIREAKRESEELVNDPYAREERLNRPVNAMGSTALEYSQGDFFSAMQRGVEKGDDGCKIMAKMYGVPDDVIQKVEEQGPRPVVAQIALGGVPSDDPLAYTMGYMRGLSAQVMDDPGEDGELAPAYIEGYKFGTKVRLGEAKKPAWAA